MSFREVSLPRKYFKYADCKPGDVLVDGGWYKGEMEGKFGIQHIFVLEDSTEVVLNSSGQLNYYLQEKTRKGDFCKVVYEGKTTLTKGRFSGKDAHNFRVFTDPSRYGMTAGFQEIKSDDENEASESDTF